jgi:hypothetical protein
VDGRQVVEQDAGQAEEREGDQGDAEEAACHAEDYN